MIRTESVETKRKKSESALRRVDKPMHDPEIVARKIATFKKNFNAGTRRRFSDAAKKKWKDPRFREIMKKAHSKRFKENTNVNDESIAKAGIISRLAPSRRKRSKSKERQESNTRLLPKLGKEIRIRHTEEERENDYSGVVRV